MFFAFDETSHGHATNPLYALRDELRAGGADVVDLISGNVNEHGVVFPQEELKRILAEAAAQARVYRPDPLGQRPAREAIAQLYAGLPVTPERVILTPGTSVSYWYCFRLLAQPGDAILCPAPSYPLFDYIARLAGVEMGHYRLDEKRAWAIDLDDLEANVTPRTRAIVLISPHNPTGMVAGEQELEGLAAIARRHELAIISDEVFSPFLFGLDALPRPAAGRAPLVFTMNGLSKMFALPGMKVGWIAVSGDEELARQAVRELELISDTFLPVNEVAQFSAPGIISHGQGFLRDYHSWVATCRNTVLARLRGMDFVAPRGGFYATVRIDGDEDETVLGLLEHEHVLVHPGWFYDMPGSHIVMTFVHDIARLERALDRLRAFLRSRA